MIETPASSINPARGYPIALLSAAVLSLTAIFIRYLSVNHQMPSMILAFWRDLFSFLVLSMAILVMHPMIFRVNRKDVKFLVIYGIELAIMNAAWTYSVALNGAALATVLIYSSTAFTVLMGWLFLSERLNGPRILAVLFGFSGCILVSGALHAPAWRANTAGILTGVFSGFCYAVYTLLGRSAARRGLNPWTTVVHTFFYASVILFIFNLYPGGLLPGTASGVGELLWLGSEWSGWLVLLVLAAGPTVLGYGLYTVSLVYLPSGTANLIATLEPVFTAMIAYALLGERLTGAQLIGSAFILGGIIYLRLSGDGHGPGR